MAEEEIKPKPQTQFLVIKIPKPQHLERMLWVCITLALAVIAFYQPLVGSITCGSEFITANWFGSSETAGAVVSEPEVVIEEVKVAPVVEEPEIVEEKSKVLSGLISFKIIKVNSVKKSSDWGKIISVDYEIDNQKTEFYPLIQVFAYDESDGSEVKKLVKGEKESISPISAGEISRGTVELFDGSFDDLTTPKTVTLHLLDQGSEKLLKAVTTIISIN